VFTAYGSERVETKINHRKTVAQWKLLNIYPSRKPPSSLVENILGNRKQEVAPSNHAFPLILREQETPKLNPVDHSMDNLQKISRIFFVKNKIIPTIPNRPT
jgi:hypothetical protein